MKNKFYLTFILICSAFAASAQTSGGPDQWGYKWRNSNDPNNATYHWTFGDGDSSALVNPGHTYSAPGTYTVCLSGTNIVSRCSDTYCYDVVVADTSLNCTASFYGKPDPTNPDSINFSNISYGGLTYHWTFGDGDSADVANPGHTYASPGQYNVCLTITDSVTLCSNTYCYNVIAPDKTDGCYANFYAEHTTGPDVFQFTNLSVERVVYNWIDIVNLPFSNEVKDLSDDNTKGSFPIGFKFHYYWYDDSVFWVGSNGYISFKNGQASSPFSPIPSAGKLDDFIAGMEGDLNFTSTDLSVVNPAKCWHYYTPAGDSLIVTYDSVPFWTNLNTWSFQGFNSFQIILSNVDSSITLQYKYVSDSAYNAVVGGYLVTGIESKAGSIGLQHLYNLYPENNLAVKFYYPVSPTYVVKDAATGWADNEISGGRFVSKNGAGQTLQALIQNAGNQTTLPFNVTANVINPSNQYVVTNTVSTDTLLGGQSENMTFGNSWYPNVAGTHRFQVNTFLPADIVASNDLQEVEMVCVDTTTTSQWLSFDNGVVPPNGAALSWLGGNGGAAVQFVPPYYPCLLNSIRYYIVNNISTTGNPEGFSAMVYDDHGALGTPLFMLDSEFLDPLTVIPNSWNVVPLINPIQIDSGSVYVVWYMGGDGIQLGTTVVKPISHRTFEILGNAFANYRDRDTADLMININISIPPSTIGIHETTPGEMFSNIYPNPSGSHAQIDYYFEAAMSSVTYSIYDLQGKLIFEKKIPVTKSTGTISLPVNTLSPGIYTCKLKAGEKEITKKLTVIK